MGVIIIKKSFDLSKKSDLKKFEKELNNAVINEIQSSISKNTFDVTCPHCSSLFQAYEGKNICPFCNNEVDLTLKFNF